MLLELIKERDLKEQKYLDVDKNLQVITLQKQIRELESQISSVRMPRYNEYSKACNKADDFIENRIKLLNNLNYKTDIDIGYSFTYDIYEKQDELEVYQTIEDSYGYYNYQGDYPLKFFTCSEEDLEKIVKSYKEKKVDAKLRAKELAELKRLKEKYNE